MVYKQIVQKLLTIIIVNSKLNRVKSTSPQFLQLPEKNMTGP